MTVLVVGSVALDTVRTPFGSGEEILGGSADLAESNLTTIESEPSFVPPEYSTHASNVLLTILPADSTGSILSQCPPRNLSREPRCGKGARRRWATDRQSAPILLRGDRRAIRRFFARPRVCVEMRARRCEMKRKNPKFLGRGWLQQQAPFARCCFWPLRFFKPRARIRAAALAQVIVRRI